MLAGEAGQHAVTFEDLNIDMFLEVQNKRYNQILYLIDYIVYGLHLLYDIYIYIYMYMCIYIYIYTRFDGCFNTLRFATF